METNLEHSENVVPKMQNMKIDENKMATDVEVKKEIVDNSDVVAPKSVENDTEKTETNPAEMDIDSKDTKELPVENEIDLEATPDEKANDIAEKDLQIRIIPKGSGIGKITVDGIEEDEKDTMLMSAEDMYAYIEKKIDEYSNDPTINPLLKSAQRIMELKDESSDIEEDIQKLNKSHKLLLQNQERFLRKMGILPKIRTTNVGVSVDLAPLGNYVPQLPSNTLLPSTLATKNPTIVPKTVIPAVTPATKVVSQVAQNTPIPIAPKPAAAKAKPAENIECIDLTDDVEPTPAPIPPPPPPAQTVPVKKITAVSMLKHPAPLPPRPYSAANKSLPGVPPKPRLCISTEERGIVLQWDMPPSLPAPNNYDKITTFEIFGYQEQVSQPINTLLWKQIGSVKAMSLPMACTLTQFVEGNRYHFSLRAVDCHNRRGSYADPISVIYNKAKCKK